MPSAPWTSKPWPGVPADTNGPLGARCLAAFALNEGVGALVHNAAWSESPALTSTLAWTPTPSGPGLLFSAGVQQATLPAVARYRPAAGISFVARVRPSSVSAAGNVMRCDDGATNRLFLIDILATGFARAIGFATSTNATATGATTLVANAWYDLAGTFDATTKVVNIYVNGVLDGTATATGTFYRGSSPAVTYLGFATASSVNAMLGSVAHWMIFAGALSAADVAALAANPWQVFQPRATAQLTASSATLTGPTSGLLDAPSSAFTVTLDAPAGAGGVVVTPSSTIGADTFS